MEIWKDITDYEDYYQISNKGRIKTKERLYTNSANVVKRVKESIKSPNNKGIVMLRNKPCEVEMLYMEHFFDEYLHKFKLDNSENREFWEPIVGYEGLYEVSSLGRIRRLPSISNNTQTITRTRNGNIETFYRKYKSKGGVLNLNKIGFPDRKGIYRLGVSLCKDNKTTSYQVSRIVAEAFIPNPNNLPEVNHINRDITNNSIENLEWISKEENIKHALIDRESIIKLYDLSTREGKTPSEMLNILINSYNKNYL